MRRSSAVLRPAGIAASVGLFLAGSAAQGQCQYEVTVIRGPTCPIFGIPVTYGYDINELGEVVGSHYQCGDNWADDAAYIWTPKSGLITLDFLPGFMEARAQKLNDLGQVVGILINRMSKFSFKAALWQDGQVFDLGILPGGNWSHALAINNKGQIAGYWGNDLTGEPVWSVFLWQNGQMVDLGSQLGRRLSRASDINEYGAVTGLMGFSLFQDVRAFIWEDGVVTELPPVPGGFTSEARAINNLGDVAGNGRLFDVEAGQVVRHAFVWTDGKMIDIGTLPGIIMSAAFDINDARQVVGRSWATGIGRAFIWQNGVMTNLNDLIQSVPQVTMHVATAINNAGQIAGHGSVQGHSAALLLTPINSPLGDLDNDCVVGLADLQILLNSWGPCPDCVNCLGDLDGNCAVAVPDLLTLLANWTG